MKSHKLKPFISNILEAKNCLELITKFCPVLIAILPAFIAKFVESFHNKKIEFSIDDFIYATIIIILLIVYYISLFLLKRLTADRAYFEEEILSLKDLKMKLNILERVDNIHKELMLQIAYINIAFDIALQHFRELIDKDTTSIEEIIRTTTSIFKKGVYNIINNYYKQTRERLTLALYYYSPLTDEYLEMLSFKDETSEYEVGRIWDSSDCSHICIVGRQKGRDGKIYGNLNNLKPLPTKSYNDDNKKYVSSISVPIIFKDSTTKQNNFVLSLTSSIENRFNIDNQDEFIVVVNNLFCQFIINVATLLEIAFNKHLNGKDKELTILLLKKYEEKRPSELKETHKKLLHQTSDLV